MIGLERIALDPAALGQFTVEYRPDLLGGVNVIHGAGQVIGEEGWGSQVLYRYNQLPTTAAAEIVAVPYATWDNREPGEMRVWFRMG